LSKKETGGIIVVALIVDYRKGTVGKGLLGERAILCHSYEIELRNERGSWQGDIGEGVSR
jgi:hypothetical protein